ncbi:MAG: zf-TFIIB domain-containing protein [Rhodocyclaceae bacterium]
MTVPKQTPPPTRKPVASGAPCPACRAPMEVHHFKRQLHGEITLDICFPCQGIWFDDFESAQLAPAGILELFRLLHEHHDELRQPWRDALQCPRCNERLLHGLDRTRNGHFAYHRCPQKHGRFNSFSAFMQEKGFVRQLNGAEIAAMAREVQIIRCSGCGASVDIRRDNVCGHCRSPIVILDPDAIQNALSDFTQKAQRQEKTDPHTFADALLANERLKSQAARERPKSVLESDITDLVIGGVETIWNLIRR